MNFKNTIGSLIIVLCVIFQINAQKQYTPFEIYTQNNGLSNSHIVCIAQDSKGFMWFGTDNGLNKFDGFNFVSYSSIPSDSTSLPDDGITALHVDKDGVLWVGTTYGLAKFDSKTENFHAFPFNNTDSSSFNSPIRAIVEDDEGNLWLGAVGIQIFNIKSESFIKVPPVIENFSKKGHSVDALSFDNLKRLWVGLEKDGIYCMDLSKQSYQHYNRNNSALKSNAILTLLADNDNIWIGTRGSGLSVYNFKSQRITTYDNLPANPNQLKSNDIYSINIDKKGILWLGTNNNGLLLFDPAKEVFTKHSAYDSEPRFISKSIKNVYRDKNDNIWLGIHQLGVSLIRNYNNPFLDNIYKLPENTSINNSILGIFIDSSGDLWLGTDGSGLLRYNSKTKTLKQYKYDPGNRESLPSDVVRSIFEDKNHHIWIGTYKGGLSMLDKSSGKFKNYFLDRTIKSNLDYDDVVSFIEDRNGNLWIATNGAGLFKYYPDLDSFENYSPRDRKERTSICNDWLNSFFLDSKGNIWIGTYWGLSVLSPDNQKFTNYWHDPSDSKSLSHNHVFAVNEDSKGNIWVGTKYGLNCLDVEKSTFEIYTVKDGLPSNVINSILKDEKNIFWISTNNGLCRFNPETKNIKNFFYSDGLQNNEFIHNSCFKDKEGRMFFGGVSGFNSFFPDRIQIEAIFPKVFITDFQIFNTSVQIGKSYDGSTILKEAISETKEIYLNYSDNSFSFEFLALDFIQPEGIEYACKMEGFEENWNVQNFKRRFITYTNLSPGTYVFKVKASNRKDEWGEDTTNLIIHIKPPFWKTVWAYLLYFLILIGLGVLITRFIQERIKEKKLIAFEKHKNEQQEQINQAKLEFFTNVSHEFRTPLTLIIGPIESLLESKNTSAIVKASLKMMHRNANRLLRLVNQLLDLRKIEKGKLKLQAREVDVNDFIKEIFLSFGELAKRKRIKFSFEKQVPGLKLWIDIDKFDKILFNLLSNAFKFTPENGRIEMDVQIIDNQNTKNKKGTVEVTVSDNGRGMTEDQLNRVFERFYQSEDSANSIQRGSGIGLSLTKSLVELHHGEITVKSTKGEGSTFIISLPLGKEHLHSDELVSEEFLQSENLNLQPVVLDEIDDEFATGSDLAADEYSPLILLVEDNDDVRHYIKNGLKNHYRIAEAKNGLEGIEKTYELMPDLIISDVMMPEMDGIQFCKRIKTELLTCHIPVILLTAKTSIEHRIEGLETGADSFIPKPFNSRHLFVRIQKLIELRQTLKEKFKSNGHFEPIEMAITSADEKFMSKAVETIKNEISNADFNVENLGQEIGMSRGHLHRKMKGLVGQNPSEFIRTIRLKQAAHILSNENISVSEISYLVGFSSPSYFASCFHKQFGLTPTEYKNKKA